MGQFSWKDCITGKQIVDDKRKDVFLLVPQEFGGGHILEKCYDGYGHFGGYDIFDLVADWNRGFIPQMLELAKDNSWVCLMRGNDVGILRRFHRGEDVSSSCEQRHIGILMACYDKDNEHLQYPIKITYDKDAVYEDCRPSLTDPNQGWED